jgi:hypothetical protein
MLYFQLRMVVLVDLILIRCLVTCFLAARVDRSDEGMGREEEPSFALLLLPPVPLLLSLITPHQEVFF